jgi:DNA-binding NarL/FixJ family response regulator
MIRVLCVDDSVDISELIGRVIRDQPDMELVGALASADNLTEECARVRPQVVLLDLHMPGTPPLEALKELSAAAPAVRVIVFSGLDDGETVDRRVRAGAWGLVSEKWQRPDAVLDAIRRVAAGEVSVPDYA